jgi:hypothetical protein
MSEGKNTVAAVCDRRIVFKYSQDDGHRSPLRPYAKVFGRLL